MDQLLEFLHSEHDGDIFYVDLHMIQDWLVVTTSQNLYSVYCVVS